jgi:hypothetical protein
MNNNLNNATINTFKNQYLDFLKQNINYQKITDDVVSVTAPFLDRNNDFTEIYIIDSHDNNFILTDDGYTIKNLEMSGLEFDSKKRREALQTTLNRYGIDVGTDSSLYIKTSLADMPMNKHALMQCILSVNDLYTLSRDSIMSFFIEDVVDYFDKNDIRYSQDVDFRGKSGLIHNFDFLISKTKKFPERIIKVISDPTKNTNIDAALFALTDIQGFRNTPFKSYAIINDTEKEIKSNRLAAFSNCNVIPLLWRKIEDHKEELAS